MCKCYIKRRRRGSCQREVASPPDIGSLHLNYSSSLGQPPELTVEVVRNLEGLAELEGDFAAFKRLPATPCPSRCLSGSLPGAAFSGTGSSIADEPLFHVVRNREASAVAIVPLMLTRRRLGMLNISPWACWARSGHHRDSHVLGATRLRSACAHVLSQSLPKGGDWDWIEWTGCATILRALVTRGSTGCPCHRACAGSSVDLGRFSCRPEAQHPPVVASLLQLLETRRSYLRAQSGGETGLLHTALNGCLSYIPCVPPCRIGPHPNHFAGSGAPFPDEVCGELAARDMVRRVSARDRRCVSHRGSVRGRRQPVPVLLGLRSRMVQIQRP